MLLSSWWFWIIVIAIIGLVIGIILFFATDFNRLIVYGLLGVFILLLILGIVFAIRSYRKPKPKQNFGDRFIPGFSEGRAIAGKTGLSDLRRKVTGSTTGALGSAGRGIGRTAKGIYSSGRVQNFVKGAALSTALGGPFSIYGTAVGANVLFRNKEITRKNKLKDRMKVLQNLQAEQQLQQAEQQLQQQQMGGMPQQQMDGMSQQQMGGMPQQQMDGMSQQQMGGMPQQQMVPQY